MSASPVHERERAKLEMENLVEVPGTATNNDGWIGERSQQTRPKYPVVGDPSVRYRRGDLPPIEHLDEPQWSTSAFLRITFYHAALPLSLPLMFLWESTMLVRNMGFTVELSPSFFFNYVPHFLVLFVDAVYIWQEYGGLNEGSALLVEEVVVLNLTHFIRLCMIATKYGFVLSDPWWSRRFNTEHLPPNEFASLLLATWNTPDKETLDREIEIAEQRIGEVLENHKFCYATNTEEILRVNAPGFGSSAMHARGDPPGTPSESSSSPVGPAQTRTRTRASRDGARDDRDHRGGEDREDGPVCEAGIRQTNVTVRDFCRQMILRASEITMGSKLIITYALLYSLAPTAYRLAKGISMSHWSNASTISVSTVVTFIMFRTLLTFLETCVNDYRRRALVQKGLSLVMNDTLRDHALVALHERHALSPTERFLRSINLLPSIDLTIPSNVRSFALIHELFGKIGAEYRARIQVYNIASFAFVLAILIVMFGQALADKDSLGVVTIYYATATTLPLCFLLGIMASAGAGANAQALIQQHSILRVKARIGEALSDMDPDTAVYRRLSHAERLLGTAEKLLAADDRLNPVTVLGIRASGSALGTGMGTFFTVVALIIQILST